MKRKEHAFTLLEIMLVVSIIAVLMSVAIFKIKGNLDVSKRVAVQSDIQSVGTQLKLYETLNGFLPTTEQGLQAMITPPVTEPRPTRWTQLFDSLPKDPWRSDYVYLNPGRKNPNGYDLYSPGPDRKADTADDDWGQ
jgi:general secretion pathway protein G